MENGFQQKFGTLALWCMGLSALYFSFYLLLGANSIFVLSDMRHELASAQTRMDQTKVERIALEDKVMRLRPETLDWDMAETEAVKVLGERVRTAPAAKEEQKTH